MVRVDLTKKESTQLNSTPKKIFPKTKSIPSFIWNIRLLNIPFLECDETSRNLL